MLEQGRGEGRPTPGSNQQGSAEPRAPQGEGQPMAEALPRTDQAGMATGPFAFKSLIPFRLSLQHQRYNRQCPHQGPAHALARERLDVAGGITKQQHPFGRRGDGADG